MNITAKFKLNIIFGLLLAAFFVAAFIMTFNFVFIILAVIAVCGAFGTTIKAWA